MNTTDSAVRITHLPTGVIVAMQDEKIAAAEQGEGDARAASKAPRARAREAASRMSARRGTRDRVSGERAEKIRTYNYPENRITDHRIKLTAHRLDQVLNGDLEEFTEALQGEDRRLSLEAAGA